MKAIRQKTIRIDKFNDALVTYGCQDEPPFKWLTSPWNIGQEVILVERCDLTTGKSAFRLYLHDGRGISGNTDRRDRRYHGWRGTTNNIAVYAHGVRKIESIQKLNGWDIKVRVGKDLHPDWD